MKNLLDQTKRSTTFVFIKGAIFTLIVVLTVVIALWLSKNYDIIYKVYRYPYLIRAMNVETKEVVKMSAVVLK